MKRKLILTMAIVSLLCSIAVPAQATTGGNDPVVSRFVVVSDVHTNPISTAATIDRLPKVFDTAYSYASGQGGTIDAFVFNGDSVNGNEASSGYISEDEWKLFLAGVRHNVKDGSKILMTLARTHDIYDGDGNIFYVGEAELGELIKEYLGDSGIVSVAENVYDPHLTMVSGVPVITLSNDMDNGTLGGREDDNADNSYHNSEDWLDAKLAALVSENPNRPIFVVFHYPETGKLGWTQRWGQNSLRDTLNKYPQVIAMNAHVHWDPRLSDAITQGQFTEVYDGAIRDTLGPDATTINGGTSPITSYSIVEVTQSGAVTIKYIDPDTGNLLKEANGSGEVLEYSIPKAWDKSTWLYTDEAKFAVAKAKFASDASIILSGSTLTFDRASSEHPVIRYRVDVDDGNTTTSQYVFSELYNATLPVKYSATLSLKADVEYTITVTAIDGIYRESANTLALTREANASGVITGSATEVVESTYGENGAEDENHGYPYFRNYATTENAESITNWAISTIEDLKAWSEFSKSNTCEGMTFHLVNDIDMQNQIFGMIGSIYVPFKGTFNGNMHTISNLFIDDTDGMGTGFFVKTENAYICNFGITSGLVRGHVSNRKYENSTTIPRPSFIDVIGVGAIAGRADNTTFIHVWNGAQVTYRDDHMQDTFKEACYGGLVGRAQSACTFISCYNTGAVRGLGRASGITNWAQNGANTARIINCFNVGQITTTNGGQTEAIARYNTASAADNSYFSYHNYYLEGSADVACNRDENTGYSNGAQAPTALTAEQIKTELANMLNEFRGINGEFVSTAFWKTDRSTGIPYIASLDGTDPNPKCEECVDADPKDHVCDVCGEPDIGGACADGDDADHTCDHCGGEVEGEECVDTAPKDHVCDECGATEIGGACADGDDANHTCDYCGGEVEGEACVDAEPKDHVCDECGTTEIGGACSDGDDANHTCDYCGGAVEGEKCVDSNNDLVCDECGNAVTPVSYPITEYAAYKDTVTTFTVASAADMVKLAEISKSDSLEGKTILMLNSIDMGSVDSFAGIGSTTYPFKGTFNGQYWTVSNLTLSNVKDRGGLFNQITGGNVKNLTISNAAVTSNGNFGLLAYKLDGTVRIENVHVKNSIITAAGNYNSGFIYAVTNNASTSYTLSYCTADNLTIDGLTNSKQQSAVFVAGIARYTTIDHCKVTNSIIQAHRNAGIISAAGVQNTTVTNFISYGNTLNCNYNTIGLIANTLGSDKAVTLNNCVFYPTAGEHSKSSTASSNFTLFGNPGVAGKLSASKVYMAQNNETALKDTVTTTTEEELASGAIAYQLGWSMKDGKICFPDGCKVTVKYTYQYDDGTEAVRYTDYAGNVIGEIPAAPEGCTWSETTLENGDKVFQKAYYSIADYETVKDMATTFTVASAADMVKLAEVSKADSLEGKTILMLNSIDMGSVDSFAGIGSTTSPFQGTFNGQYYTVSNLMMSGTKLGMFVQITAGQVQNLTISNANIASTGYCGVLAYHLVGAVKITNVHIKDSTITPTGNVNGGFAATCEKDGIRKEISYCTVDNLTIAGGKEQAGAVVGGMPRYVTIDHCMVTNSTINATKSAGLVTSSNTLDTVITNFISYGNTVNCGNTYGWLIANTYSADNSALENCVFYPTAGTKNGTANKFTLFNTYKNTNATNVYVSPNNETGSHATEAAEADWTSGAIAYQLGWSMKDGTVCFPDGCKATVKYTYHDAEGNVTAELYTDYAGNVIGEIPTAPEGYTWSETTQENGDKVFAPELLPAVVEEGTES